jgi:benzoate membrane transport protein
MLIASMLRNLRDLPHALTLTTILTGLLPVLIGYPSSLVIVLQAAASANLSPELTTSWVMAISIGSGVAGLIMSLWFRIPVVGAWSTAGVVLLITSLSHYQYGEAIGAYLAAAAAIVILGFSGLFGRVMALVPTPIVLGMLAGILIRFGIGLFNAVPNAPLIVIPMIIVYFVLRRRNFRAPVVAALVLGLVVAALSGMIQPEAARLALSLPVWTSPLFTPGALLGLALPLFTLALTSQNAPGQAVLTNAGYDVPIDKALILTGLISVVTAPFGGHGITLAAITAALIAGPEAHPDANKRYGAGVMAGIWYILAGIFGAAIVGLFAALPGALIAATSGLGLISTIMSSLAGAMNDVKWREGALVAFMCTAANFSLFEIGAPFWGLVFGVGVNFIMTWRK